MAYAEILVTNGIEVKKVPLGYSWTVLFFGGFPPLFRGDWAWAIALFVGNLFTWGLMALVCSFFYNRTYAKSLFNKGYRVHMLPPNVTEDSLKNYLGFLHLPSQPTAA